MIPKHSFSRENLVYLAELADEAERFEGKTKRMLYSNSNFIFLLCYVDVVLYMNEVSRMGVELSINKRDLIIIGHNHVVNSLRSSWHTLFLLEKNYNEKGDGTTRSVELIRERRTNIGKEFEKVCEEFLSILDEHLIPLATTSEAKLFYLKK